MKEILLIVPCYNEEKRLNFTEFKRYSEKIDFLFVDDGSIDKTAEIITQNNFEVLSKKHNQGKASAIYDAYHWIKSNNRNKNYKWIGYWDADLTIPLSTVEQLLQYLVFYPNKKVDAIWSSRNCRLGSRSRDNLIRHIFGRVFAKIANMFLNIQAYDSQCGAKIFTSETAELAFYEPFVSKWIFDIEIVKRLNDKFIVEFPLINWIDMGGSKLKLSREFLNILIDLIKIKIKYN